MILSSYLQNLECHYGTRFPKNHNSRNHNKYEISISKQNKKLRCFSTTINILDWFERTPILSLEYEQSFSINKKHKNIIIDFKIEVDNHIHTHIHTYTIEHSNYFIKSMNDNYYFDDSKYSQYWIELNNSIPPDLYQIVEDYYGFFYILNLYNYQEILNDMWDQIYQKWENTYWIWSDLRDTVYWKNKPITLKNLTFNDDIILEIQWSKTNIYNIDR